MTNPRCCICGLPINKKKNGYRLLNKHGAEDLMPIKDIPRSPNADIIVDGTCLFGLPNEIRDRIWLRITKGIEEEK